MLGGDVLGLALCLPWWPPRPRDPAWACWGWRALATRLALVACLLPWDGGSPRAGFPTMPPPPPPWGGGPASGAGGGAVEVVPPFACTRPATGPAGLWGLLLCPPGLGGERREGQRRRRSSVPAQGAGGLRGEGRNPLALTPPLRPWLPCGASVGIGLCPRGPAPMLASFPCPALTGCRTPRLRVTVPAARCGRPAHVVVAASHACLWPRRPAPLVTDSACPVV